MRWKCPACNKAITLPDDISWPIHHCGQRHEFPVGIVKDIPSLTRRAANFATAGVKHLATGSRYVDDATRQWRLDQCLSCTQYYDPEKETCSHPQCGCGIKKVRGIIDKLGWASQRCPIGRWDNPPIPFLTHADLTADSMRLLSLAPPDIAGIVAVPRSGIMPAGVIATAAHLPLYVLNDAGLMPTSGGFRTVNLKSSGGPMLVVDDSSMYGGQMALTRGLWNKFGSGRPAVFSAVYCAPQSFHRHGPMPDLFVRELPAPHIFEWNFFNNGYIKQTAFDFDGIICRDDGGQAQYLPRLWPVPLIVTGRLEKYRRRTEEWLAQHKITVHRLQMFPGNSDPKLQSIAEYKARHFAESGLTYFAESDPEQAKLIAKLTGKMVVCPIAKRVF